MARIHNFNPGPSALPFAAIERAHAELLDYDDTGMCIMEHSHRGKWYDAVHSEALSLLRELAGIGDDYYVLLLQGGASLQFAQLVYNFMPPGGKADYIITGTWAKKAYQEAERIEVGTPRIAADMYEDGSCKRIPKQSELDLDPKAGYVHITTNNTISGTQYHELPDTGDVPLIADMSSDIIWRPFDVSRYGMLYAGAQKNIGPSGLAVVVLRKSLLEKANKVPNILNYQIHADKNSLYHTPNTWGVYMMRNVLAHLKEIGGLAEVERRNRKKAEMLYSAIEGAPDFYRCPVETESRSLMNVVWRLPTEELEKKFIADAAAQGMNGLKGHRSVGGCRASIYNGVPVEAVETLVQFMGEFHKKA